MSPRPARSLLLAHLGDVAACVDLARQAEGAGAVRAFATETDGPDAFLVAAAIGLATGLEVGTAIVPVPSRSPAVLAMSAAGIANLTGRPFHLGIGAGGRAIVERWHGQSPAGALEQIEDALAILRPVLDGLRSDHRGDRLHSEGFQLSHPPAVPVRLLVGGMGPRAVDLAARSADGLITSWCTEAGVAERRERLDELAGDGTPTALLVRAYVAVTNQADAVRDHVRRELVEYVVSPPYGRALGAMGFASEVERASTAFADRDRAAAVAAISDRMLDELLIAGPPARCRDHLDRLASAGADEILVQPVPASLGGDPGRTVAEMFS